MSGMQDVEAGEGQAPRPIGEGCSDFLCQDDSEAAKTRPGDPFGSIYRASGEPYT